MATLSIGFRSTNGRWLCADGGGGGRVLANRATRAQWETFLAVTTSGGSFKSGEVIVLFAGSNAADFSLVNADGTNDGKLRADRPLPPQRPNNRGTLFKIEKVGGGVGLIAANDRVTLKCVESGKYVCAENGGSSPDGTGGAVAANRAAAAAWETFTVGYLQLNVRGIGDQQLLLRAAISLLNSSQPGQAVPKYTPLPAATLKVDGTFEGGGSLGCAYVGTVLALARNGVWFERVAGTSAGAIISSIIAAGYDANQIDYLFRPPGINMDIPPGFPAGIIPNAMDYSGFVDPPTGPGDISQESKRGSLVHRAIRDQAIDEVLGRIRDLNLPLTPPSKDTIVNAVWNQISGNLSFSKKVTRPKIVDNHLVFRAGIPPYETEEVTVTVGPSDAQATAIKERIKNALPELPSRRQLADLPDFGPEARTQLADKTVDALLHNGFYRALLQICGDGGLLNGDAFLNTMRTVIGAKFPGLGRPVTFNDLPIPLTVVAADATSIAEGKGNPMLVYSKITGYGSMEVAEAVRRSMSIPFVYEPRRNGSHDIVDGGVLANFPFWVHLLDGGGNLIDSKTPDFQRPKVGFLLDSDRDSATGCPAGSHPWLNITVNTALELLLDQVVPDLLPNRTAPANPPIEARFLGRAMALHSAMGANSAVFQEGLWQLLQRVEGLKMLRATIPLKGFFWLDFFTDASTYRGMCCRGWDTCLRILPELQRSQQKDKVPGPNMTKALISQNPYKG